MLCNEACGLRSESHVITLRSELLCLAQITSLGPKSLVMVVSLKPQVWVGPTSDISDPMSGLRLQALVSGLWSCLRVSGLKARFTVLGHPDALLCGLVSGQSLMPYI